MNNFSKYNDNLKNVKIEGGTLMDLHKFQNALNTVFTPTLNANKGLGGYDKLKRIFSTLDVLVPPLGHTQRNQSINDYENYTRVLRDHLLKKYSINKETRPRTFRTLTRNQLNKDEFYILTKIVIKYSPQLDGDERDSINYVKELKIQDGKIYEIELQQDNTG